MNQQEIKNLSSTGRYQECLQACQQLLQHEPKNPVAWKYAGKSLGALGQFEKAIQYLTKAHELDINDPETTKDIGNAFLGIGSTDKATKWYIKSLDINNSYAPAFNNLGNINRKSGNNQEAVRLYKRAIQLDPNLIQAYAGATASLLEMKDFDQAEAYSTQAVKINPKAPGINELLGIAFQNKKKFHEAANSYQKELSINPQSKTSILNLGLIYLQEGRFTEAVQLLSRAALINPSEQLSLLLAQAYQNIGKLKEAITEYKKIEIKKSTDKIIPFKLGLCLLKNGSNMNAIQAFKQAIEIDDSFLPAWENMGIALRNEGRHHEAFLTIQKILKLDPNNPEAFTNLGVIYKDIGNLDQALASTLKSLELKPDSPTALLNLGGIYKDLGNFDQALAYTLKSLELKPDSPTALMNLGSIYKDLGNLDQALASTLKSLELKADNPDVLLNLGGIYKDLGNFDQALTYTLKHLEAKPANPTAHIKLGSIYKDLERIEEAKTAFNEALKARPKKTSTVAIILDFYDSINEEELLKQAIIHLKNTLSSENSCITMYEARALFRKKNYRESWDKLPAPDFALKHLNDWFSISKYHEFRAQIAEKNNNYDAAYDSFKASQMDPMYRLINHKKEHERITEYISLSINMSKHESHIYPSHSIQNQSHPVFLLGFPRSGTTLLDTALRSHPDVEVIEEKNPLALTERFGIKSLKSQISKFDSLNEDDLNKMRALYQAKLNSHTENNKKLVIDKLPLHTIAIPLINLLFPNAKIIFALRHPCDSILSCFQQTFKPNTAMANFTDLDKSVAFYDKVMTGWSTYNKNLRLDYKISKYEELVENFDESISRLLNHLNLPWNDSVRDYISTASSRSVINTPSSSQVIQPLYKSSIGRWRNYQKHFSKHMNTLNPWINYFEYDL